MPDALPTAAADLSDILESYRKKGKTGRPPTHPADYGLISIGDAALACQVSVDQMRRLLARHAIQPTGPFSIQHWGQWDNSGQDDWGPWYRWVDVLPLYRAIRPEC